MEGLSANEVQELIDLTPEQKKAWAALVRAVNRCKKEGILFYAVLDTMGAVNGLNAKSIHCDEDHRLSGIPEHIFTDERWMGVTLNYPSVEMSCSFADDSHYVELVTD